MPPNGVSWTIQTMSYFYFSFPYMLPWLRHVVRQQKVGWTIALLYLLQLFTYVAAVIIPNNYFYWTARAWPFSRLPVFAMGCLAAIDRLHGRSPASCYFCCLHTCCCVGGSEAAWGRRTDF